MTAPRRNARGEASLQRILEATVRLIGQHGYDNTTIASVTKATQRPASSIYWYFDTKDALIAKALESSYQGRAASPPSWSHFEPGRPLLDQLVDELEPELRVAESEKPLRLGLMLALEGSANQPAIQEPFRRRRAGARERVHLWWGAAFAARGADGMSSYEAATSWMAALTLTFLDGHYFSDLDADEETALLRARIVAHALAGAYETLLRGTVPQSPATQEQEAEIDLAPPVQDERGVDALLRITRSLVAERGYEGATIGRICEASGLKRSSVYWRYQDKDALVSAAVADPFLALLQPLGSLPDPGPSWVDDLAVGLRATLRAAQADPDTVKAGLLLKAQRWDPPTSAGSALVEGSQRWQDDLGAWFERIPPLAGGEAGTGQHLAWAVGRLVEGFMLGAALGRLLGADDMARMAVPMLASTVGRPVVRRPVVKQ